ncbi:MAG: BatA domain-containing protein [Aureliella sp.]
MSFLQPILLFALPLIALPIVIHLINQWRYQTKSWGAMQFLLKANKMNRGFAKIRQWLILAMRTLAVAGLLFAVARPLSSGLLGFAGGTKSDTTIVIMDRSPSMQQASTTGVSKIDSAKAQLSNAFTKLRSDNWVAIDTATGKTHSFENVEALLESSSMDGASTTSDIPAALQHALDYFVANNPGPTEIWICSDLRNSDWDAENSSWASLRRGFEQLPQSVRFNLLSYSEKADGNLAARVTAAKREVSVSGGVKDNALLLSIQLSSEAVFDEQSVPKSVPVQIEIDGVRSELSVELSGPQTEIRNHRIPLPEDRETGWGRISIPADANLSDNEYFFVYADEPQRRIVLVSDDLQASRPLEIAASVSPDGRQNAQLDVLSPAQVDSLSLEDAALLIWQSDLPDSTLAKTVMGYVEAGGQVMFFPPSRLRTGVGGRTGENFGGVAWESWSSSEKVMVENWRSDQDLLAATDSGMGLPVGQVELNGFATLDADSELIKLATLTGGNPLLAKLPTDKGGVYFMTASPDPTASSLAESGIVIFVAVQRAIEAGQSSLGYATQRVAGEVGQSTADWTLVAGNQSALSSEFESHGGVYRMESGLFAINRRLQEDQRDQVGDEKLEELFEGLSFSRVEESAGSLSGVVREVWRIFLILMILALIAEAILCVPRRVPRRTDRQGSSFGAAS